VIIPQRRARNLILYFCFLFNLPSYGENITVDTASAIPESIKKQTPGEIKYKAMFTDRLGRHFLILTRDYKEDADEKETISLHAHQFLLTNSTWKQEWVIKDSVECHGVDIDGNFVKDPVSLTDIDGNKIVETTVAYYLICTGGVAPKKTKAILRQGENKYTIQGESLVRIDAKTSFGGTFSADQILDTKSEFKTHLIVVWKKAAGVN
jgi:hypothetical protein